MLLKSEEFELVKQSLPDAFLDVCKNEQESIIRVYPLLSLICKDQMLIAYLHEALKLPSFLLPKNQPSLTQDQLRSLCQSFSDTFTTEAVFKHSLPLILGDFPIHTRPINKAIEVFNQLIEHYHQNYDLDQAGLKGAYHGILEALNQHGSFCYSHYIWQLILLLNGWSKEHLERFFKKHEAILANNCDSKDEQTIPTQEHKALSNLPDTPIKFEELSQNTQPHHNPFVPNYNHNINRAGRLATETYFLLLNAFGMKVGGHFDAQVHYAPRLIPLNQLHSAIARQLSHRLEVPQTINFEMWLELTINELGIRYVQTANSELYVTPFLTQPLSSLTPEKIRGALEKGLLELENEPLHPDPSDLKIIADYLFELLQGFQIQPGQALGIGANWDGTVNLSNEAGAYPFKFIEGETNWGERFKQISLLRAGSAEIYMNAAKGVKYEFQALVKGFQLASQLKPSEHKETIYKALVDNLMTDLLPEPAYFENSEYPKHRKQHLVKLDKSGQQIIESFYIPCNNGTYFKDREGKFKQTPMYRRAGTLDVQVFPKNIVCSAESGASYAENLLAPHRLQYLQSLHASTRGHMAYNPLGRHSFLPDVFYGEVLRNDNGDLIPFAGVVPKNLDKHLKLPKELCASFVFRMLHSSRLMVGCPTFHEACNRIKSRFLPREKPLPGLPNLAFGIHISQLHQTLQSFLEHREPNFSQCEKAFFSLFKNIVYHLYGYGKEDKHFRSNYTVLINDPHSFHPANRATCEKIIRYLSVNNPVFLSPTAKKSFDECLNYLRVIVQYFFPTPTDQLAKEIAKQAKIHTKNLVNSTAIKTYFSGLKASANLSPRQTPGMAYAALKYGSASKAIINDYGRMHSEGFLSYYRDPEGTPYGEPQTYETELDLAAKLLGASLQLAHRYNLFSLIREPLVQPYLQAKEMAALHRNQKLKPLWITLGAMKGFFWNGVCQGTWKTLKTPIAMIADFLSLLDNDEINKEKNYALAISAAPLNEPNNKVKLIAKIRDFILQMLIANTSNAQAKKSELINYSAIIISELHSLPEEELELWRQHLKDTFPLNQSHLSRLSNPFSRDLDGNNFVEKQVLIYLQNHTQRVTKDLIYAVFKCIVDPTFSIQPKKSLAEARSFWKLNKEQKKALKDFIALYNELPADQRHKFTQLFQFDGKIHQALIKKDKLIHLLQHWLSSIFNGERVIQTPLAQQAVPINEQAEIGNGLNHSILGRAPRNDLSPKDHAHNK